MEVGQYWMPAAVKSSISGEVGVGLVLEGLGRELGR